MNKFAIIAAFVFTASAAAAQSATPNGQAQSPPRGGATESTQAPITGVFCIEEMTASFCNVLTGPNRRLWRKKRFRIDRRIDQRIEHRSWRQRIVDSAMPRIAAVQRIVQLIESGRTGVEAPPRVVLAIVESKS